MPWEQDQVSCCWRPGAHQFAVLPLELLQNPLSSTLPLSLLKVGFCFLLENKYPMSNSLYFAINTEKKWELFFFFFSSTTFLLPTHLPPPLYTHAQSCNPMDCSPPGSSSMDFSRQEYWSGLPENIFLTILLYSTYLYFTYYIIEFFNWLRTGHCILQP